MKRIYSSLVATIFTLIIIGSVFVFLSIEATMLLKEQDGLIQKLMDNLNLAFQKITETLPIALDPMDDPKKLLVSNLVKIAASNISSISEDLVIITLIPMYVFFILLYRGHFMKFIHQRYEGSVQTQALAFVSKAKESINNYIKGTLILTGISAVMTYVILLLFGIKAAFFFGVFLAILNLIPYVGNLIGMIVILVFVFVSKDSVSTTIFIAIAIYVANMIQENFLKPKLIGDKMEMNAGVVFTSVIIGGLIWGFSGMILFIPLSGIVKAFLDNSPSSKSFSVFFES